MAFAAAAVLFSSCDPAGVGVAFPKEPRIEYEEKGYQAIVGENESATSFILRWTASRQESCPATYTIFLSSLDSEEVMTLDNTSVLVENEVREMQIKQSDLVAYAAQLGYQVTANGITDANGAQMNSVSFRINVSAKDANGDDFPQPAIYTRYAPVTLVPQAIAE